VDDGANIRQLVFGRCEAIVADFIGTIMYANDNKISIHPSVPSRSVDRLYASFDPERVELQRMLDAAIHDMLMDGTVDRIYRAHVETDFSEILGQ